MVGFNALFSFKFMEVSETYKMSFVNWPIRKRIGESGTLLIFKVEGQGHRVRFLGEGICHAMHCPFICIKDFNAQTITSLKLATSLARG
jgi:hypothetical protein